MKTYKVMVDGQNFFDQPVRNDLITYDNVREIATGQKDDSSKLVVCWAIITFKNIIR